LGVVVGLFLAAAGPALADVKLPAILADHMVLQQGADIHLWGWADPGERIAVAFADQKAETAADENGRWAVRLRSMKAGGPFDLVVQGRNTITCTDVLVGEVWLCAGQSNMGVLVRDAAEADRALAEAEGRPMRLFTVGTRVADEPAADVDGRWVLCRSETVADFSAVGYFFGRDLAEHLRVPVGLICASLGATRIAAWASPEALRTDPAFQKAVAREPQILQDYVKNLAEAKAHWRQEADKARAEGRPVPPPPGEPSAVDLDLRTSPGRPGGCFNGMVAPLIPYALAGIIWYQGESDVNWPQEYRQLLPALITDWRRLWGQGNLPFLFVQLANFGAPAVRPEKSDYAELREAQQMALALPQTGMAVAIDLGEADNIHPKNKQEVGRRLVLAARAVAYGEPIEYSGPIVQSAVREGGKVRLSFSHVGSGLVAQGDKLSGFAIAGEDRKFAWADARIDGDTVLVWSDRVARPAAVRYGWADNPECTLYNREGLPASPFHSAVQTATAFNPHLLVRLHASWMILAVAVGTVAGYLGLVRATQREALRVPGRFSLRLHKWTGIAFYAMLYLGILGGFSMVEFVLGAEPVGFWLWHQRLGLLIGLVYAPAAWFGLGLLRKPAGPARARPIAHMVLNFTGCVLIAAQIVLAAFAIGWL
jgi:sialate O-acetylesterase